MEASLVKMVERVLSEGGRGAISGSFQNVAIRSACYGIALFDAGSADLRGVQIEPVNRSRGDQYGDREGDDGGTGRQKFGG